MKRTAMILACLACLGCAKPPEKVVQKKQDYTQFTDASCYTVDLFDEFSIQPASATVPAAHRQYLGEWGNGAWNGNWCHDLTVLSVNEDGVVDLLSMHAPKETIGHPATVFRRKGFIDNDGNLRFTYGKETHVYRLDGKHLVGKRRGVFGEWEIAMTRKDAVRLPVARPNSTQQLAQQ